jgi:hypothetical protein
VALLAVLLPAIGIAVRIVGFSFQPRMSTSLTDLAVAAPVGSLAVLGLEGIAPALLVFAITYFVLRNRGRETDGTPPPGSSDSGSLPRRARRRISRTIGLSFALVVAVAFLVGGSSWQSNIVTFPSGIVATLLFMRLWGRGDFTFARAWVILLPIVLIQGPLSGLNIVRIPSGYVTLAPGTGQNSGNYSVVGVQGDMTYLLPCISSRPLVGVGNEQVKSIVYYKPHAIRVASFYAAVVEHHSSPVGAVTSCPT